MEVCAEKKLKTVDGDLRGPITEAPEGDVSDKTILKTCEDSISGED